MVKNRRIFEKLLSEKSNRKVSILLGPRQVGKTTALEFLHNNLCTEKNNGLFLDLDIYSNFEKVSTYEDAINTFKLSGFNPDAEDVFYVFLDEFQRYKDITRIIKNICDHNPNVKIYATESSSLAIKHRIQESLAGRKIITHFFPLDFNEFLFFRGNEELVNSLKNLSTLSGKTLFQSTKELFAALEQFMVFGAYPEVVLTEKPEDKIEILKGIFDLYAKKELIEYLKINKIHEVKKMIQYLAVNNTQKIKYQNLAQLVGLSQKTVKSYIEIMKETFLITELRPFFTNKNKELVKIPKIYFLDSGVANFFTNNFNALNLRNDASYLFENFCLTELFKNGIELDSVNFWQNKNRNEVDFVLQRGESLVGIEIKYKMRLKHKDFSSLNLFLKEYPHTIGWLVNLSSQEKNMKQVSTILPYAFCYNILETNRVLNP